MNLPPQAVLVSSDYLHAVFALYALVVEKVMLVHGVVLLLACLSLEVLLSAEVWSPRGLSIRLYIFSLDYDISPKSLETKTDIYDSLTSNSDSNINIQIVKLCDKFKTATWSNTIKRGYSDFKI